MNDLTIKPTAIQIVPRRTSRPDGIGDYSTHLADAMFQRAGFNSVFLSGTPAQIEAPRADRWQNYPVHDRTPHALEGQLSELCQDRSVAAVILHVSGYGYQKRGVPFWLLKGMRTWRQTHRNYPLFGVFHELFATGRIWNSSFWLSGAQKHITRELWELCDGGLTTTSSYFDELVSWRPKMKNLLRTMPVFSNVGEPSFIVPIEDRPLHMAVFGQPGVGNLYASPLNELAASAAEKLAIQQILDIGARNAPPPRQLGRIPIVSLGQLPPDLVSRHLGLCRFGLLTYDVKRLEKSGVFAAYAAHGVIPVCIGSEANLPDGLEAGRHFIRWPLQRLPDFSAMQRHLVQWYRGHSITLHADVLTSWCGSEKTPLRLVTADALA